MVDIRVSAGLIGWDWVVLAGETRVGAVDTYHSHSIFSKKTLETPS
jgi:hypothetical protein